MDPTRITIIAIGLCLVGAPVAGGPLSPDRTPESSPGYCGCVPVAGVGHSDSEKATIRGVFPNPVAAGDAGEYVLLEFPNPTNLTGWTLSDGESSVVLGNHTVSGVVVVSPDPMEARNLTNHPVLAVDRLGLANTGDRIELVAHGVVVDVLTYEDAPEGKLYRNGEYRHRLATNRSPSSFRVDSVHPFVLPDAPHVPLATIRGANRRILLAGYTLTSEQIVHALRQASRRGVTVRVLVDAAPVGGMARRQRELLNSLVETGADVAVVGGPRTPYAFHHAKYAVVDDRVIVVTENWKPAGTGGRSSRGWGVVVDDRDLANELATVFRADRREGVAIPWERYRTEAPVTTRSRATNSYPTRFDSRHLDATRVRVFLSPDNAESELARLLRNANSSIRIQQMSMDRGPLLNATLFAARRGVRVRILLSGAWYVREENYRLVEWLEMQARRMGLDLRARMVEPRSRFEKVHAKGAVIDDDQAIVGSLNWNHRSATRNREVVLVLEGERVGRYYTRVFRADWRGGAWRLPIGVAVTLVGLVGTAIWITTRQIRFEVTRDPATPDSPSTGDYGW